MLGDVVHDQLDHLHRRVIHGLTFGIELISAGTRRAVVVEAKGETFIGRQLFPIPPDGENTLSPRTGDVNIDLDPGDVVKVIVFFLGAQKAVGDTERSSARRRISRLTRIVQSVLG